VEKKLTPKKRVRLRFNYDPTNCEMLLMGEYMDIHQQKTDKKVTVGVIDPKAIHILRKEFPKNLPHSVLTSTSKGF